jgi:hypothetical protein
MLLKGSHFHTDEALAKETGSRGGVFLIPAPTPLNKTSEGTPRRKDRPGRHPYFGSESPASSIMILPFGLLQCKCKIIW